MPTTRGFSGKGRPQGDVAARVPPGQHMISDFPVLTAGPTQRTPLPQWSFSLEANGKTLLSVDWEAFNSLPRTEITVDIHCVTTWTKLDTKWRGVTIQDLLNAAALESPPATFVMAFSDGGCTTNLPLADLMGTKAMVATHFDGLPLTAEHGGPARLLVPHLYFWKSAKWVRGLRFMDADQPGFWETHGYHLYGDPFREQRYHGD